MYIQLDVDFPEHPKVLRIAREMGWSTLETWPRIALIWIWAQRYAQDGDVTHLVTDDDHLSRVCYLQSVNLAPMFLRVLCDSKMVEMRRTKYVLHDWNKYGGKYHERRAKNTIKNRTWRNNRKLGDENKTSHDQSHDQSHDRENDPIQEKKRREEIKKELTPLTPLDILTSETVASKAASEGESEKIFAKPKDVQDAWNEICNRLPKCSVLTNTRIGHIQSAKMSINEWRGLFERMAENSFFAGDNDRGWKADIDFALAPGRRVKILEGSYDLGKKKSRDGIITSQPAKIEMIGE